MNRPGNLAIPALCLLVCLTLMIGSAMAQDPNMCDEPGEYPDLALGSLDTVAHFGVVDNIFAYSVGVSTCNLGTCWANWFAGTAQHPVFTENLFRLKDGRFEQLGQSWVTHRFFALSQSACEQGCLPTNGQHLGVNCTTTNSANLTAAQQNKGPRSEINPSSGVFPFPFTGQNVTGDAIFKRLQVHQEDLEPGLNPGARFFIEGQNISNDDATAGALHNNASWREVIVAPNTLNLLPTGATGQEQPAITAWAALDPEVMLETLDVAHEGRFFVGSRATPLGGGIWHYEYAIHNLNSHRSAMSVEIAIPAGANLSDIGFHDVDYHSGEPYDGTDWSAAVEVGGGGSLIRWSTESFAENPNANALRWGTLYNFRFDADVAPTTGELALGLFRPGSPDQLSAAAIVPALCNNDLDCDPGESSCNCAGDCGAPAAGESSCSDGLDDDCDGMVDCDDSECCGVAPCPLADVDGDAHLACEDCNDDAGALWATPGMVTGLLVDRDAQDRVILGWSAPMNPGSVSVEYEVIRSLDPDDFLLAAVCLDLPNPTSTIAVDAVVPAPGTSFFYLVRATNACPVGAGPVAGGSGGSARSIIACP